MSMVSKLLGIWAVSKTVTTTTPLFLRLILGMAAITLFAVFGAVLAAMLVAMLTWFSYTQLIAQGISSGIAVSIIALVLLSLVLVILMVIQHYWRKAVNIAKSIMYVQSPISGRLNTLAEAFMGGYKTGPAR